MTGGAFGLILGVIAVRALLAINPGNIPRIGEQGAGVTLDWHVLAFTVFVSLITGLYLASYRLSMFRAPISAPR